MRKWKHVQIRKCLHFKLSCISYVLSSLLIRLCYMNYEVCSYRVLGQILMTTVAASASCEPLITDSDYPFGIFKLFLLNRAILNHVSYNFNYICSSQLCFRNKNPLVVMSVDTIAINLLHYMTLITLFIVWQICEDATIEIYIAASVIRLLVRIVQLTS